MTSVLLGTWFDYAHHDVGFFKKIPVTLAKFPKGPKDSFGRCLWQKGVRCGSANRWMD